MFSLVVILILIAMGAVFVLAFNMGRGMDDDKDLGKVSEIKEPDTSDLDNGIVEEMRVEDRKEKERKSDKERKEAVDKLDEYIKKGKEKG